MKGMRYRCIDCDHSLSTYILDGGIRIVCKITGEVLIIHECPMGE